MNGQVTKNIETYGLLSVSEKGEEFIKNPTTFDIALDTKFERYTDDDDDSGNVEMIYDEELYAILKDLCKQEAKAKKLPMPSGGVLWSKCCAVEYTVAVDYDESHLTFLSPFFPLLLSSPSFPSISLTHRSMG